jgi:hypothetical protein
MDQLGLLEWRPAAEEQPVERAMTRLNGAGPKLRGRRTAALLAALVPRVEIRVRRSETRAADRGRFHGFVEMPDGSPLVRYFSAKNGGLYTVALDRVSLLRPRKRPPLLPGNSDE